MSNIRTFFPGGGSSNGRFISDPTWLPRIVGNRNAIQIKDAVNTELDATEAAFGSDLAHDTNMEGAYVSVAAVDTYYTICDISGAGVLGWLVSAHAESGSTGTMRFRLTVDGTEYIIQGTGDNQTMVVGSFLSCIAPTATGVLDTASVPSQYNSAGFVSNSGSDRPFAPKIFLLPTWEWLALYGTTMLRWETSFKAECWMSTLYDGTYFKRAYVAYHLL